MALAFTKIKISKNDGVHLHWTEKRDNGHELEAKLRSADDPSPEFVTALQALAPWVTDLLGLGNTWLDGLVVLSVSFTEEESGTIGLVVTSAKQISLGSSVVATAILNTPYCPEERNEETIWPSWLYKAVKELEHQAREFREGRARAQADLFGESTSGAGTDPATIVTLTGENRRDIERELARHRSLDEYRAQRTGRDAAAGREDE
jgi:hypothetical protein